MQVKTTVSNFPGGSVVKNLPSNARDAGSIPGQGTNIPHASEQLSAATTEAACSGACKPTTREKPSCHSKDPTCPNEDWTQPSKIPNKEMSPLTCKSGYCQKQCK